MGHDSGFAATPGEASWKVGQDRAGRWLAIERSGRGGGMFASREAALPFALAESGNRAEAVTISVGPVGFL